MILAVLDDLARLIDTTGSEPGKLPTPCDDFDVFTLRRHTLGWLVYFDAALGDPDGDDRPDPAAFPDAADPRTVIGKLAATIRSAPAHATVKVPQLGGVHPRDTVVDLLLIETLGHGWDLARAVGRPWTPAPATCEHALAVLRAMVRPEFRGPGLPFGPEVEVGADAPALDRFVAFTGRDPAWAPAR